jgi:hypothetical protein
MSLAEIAETIPARHGGPPRVVDECRKQLEQLSAVDLATFDRWLADRKVRPPSIVRWMAAYARVRNLPDFPVPSESAIKRYRKRGAA